MSAVLRRRADHTGQGRKPGRAAKASRAIEGSHRAKGLRIGIAVSRFNELVTDRLLEGALETLRDAGVVQQDVTVVRVPGAFELPLAARLLLRRRGCDAVICLGAVIRGETPHFDYIAHATATGIVTVGVTEERPVVFGVLTTDTAEQALARADHSGVNRGAEAAITAIEMATLARRLDEKKPR